MLYVSNPLAINPKKAVAGLKGGKDNGKKR